MLPIILSQKILHKKLFGTQVNATSDSSGPEHSSHQHALEEKHFLQRSLSRY